MCTECPQCEEVIAEEDLSTSPFYEGCYWHESCLEEHKRTWQSQEKRFRENMHVLSD